MEILEKFYLRMFPFFYEISSKIGTLREIYENAGFRRLIFSRIKTKSRILFLYGRKWV